MMVADMLEELGYSVARPRPVKSTEASNSPIDRIRSRHSRLNVNAR